MESSSDLDKRAESSVQRMMRRLKCFEAPRPRCLTKIGSVKRSASHDLKRVLPTSVACLSGVKMPTFE